MKRYLNSVYYLFLIAGLALGASSCSEDTPTDPGGEAPTITSFTATPSTIEIGSSTTLAWSVSDATTISIDNNVNAGSSSSVEIFPAQTTTYTLTATNASGTSTKTAVVTVNNPADPGAPNNPSGLTATPGNPGIITLNWTASASAQSYLVERRSTIGGFSLISTASVNSYADAGLFPGTVYTYRVRAVSGGGAKSGWSNFATATAPGTAPTIARVEITPSNPATIQPGGSVQLSAKAYDASGNDLGFAPGIFTWTSSNVTIAAVSQLGLVLAPATAQQGNAQVTAAVGGEVSAPVTINVALQKAATLVIFHPKGVNESFAMYSSALAGVSFDVLTDRAANNSATLISIEQIQDYERVFYFSHDDYALHATTKALLKLYAQMPNKKLIVMGNSNLLSDDASFRTFVGLKSDSYVSSSSVNSTFTGGAGTVMQGFNFEHVADFDYVSTMTLHETSPAAAAFTTSDASSGNPIITAIQANVGTSSKFFYAGFVLENVQANLRDDFIQKLMSM